MGGNLAGDGMQTGGTIVVEKGQLSYPITRALEGGGGVRPIGSYSQGWE